MDLSGVARRKASYSTGNGGACVDVASNLPGIVAMRDSKDPVGPAPQSTPTRGTRSARA